MLTRQEAIRILEVVKIERDADFTMKERGVWSLDTLGTLVLDNKTFSSYDEMTSYLESVIEETSGGYGDDFA